MPSGKENQTMSTVSTPSRVWDTGHAIPRKIWQEVNAPDKLEERLESGLQLFCHGC